MIPEMVLNELSLRRPAEDIAEARRIMAQFVETVRSASRAGLNRSVRMSDDMHGALIGPDYTVFRWRNDAAVDREIRTYFRSISTKVPFLTDLPSIQELSTGYDFSFLNQRAAGLGVAFLISGLSISVETQGMWRDTNLPVECSWLEGDTICTKTVSVKNAKDSQDVESHRHWIRSEIGKSVRDGADLWERRTELFPQVRFCDTVGRQVVSMQSRDLILRVLLHRLEGFNEYCSRWTLGNFAPAELPFPVNVDSPPTVDQYRANRTFVCPDGIPRVFSWHCRLSQSMRVHFLPDAASRSVTIGYVGRHLPTVKYPG